MKAKLTVYTPPRQADKCIKTQESQLIPRKLRAKIIDRNVVSDDQYYYIIQTDNQEDINSIIKRAAKGEITIKKFYSVLIKLIKRANKLANKFTKGISWVRKYLVRMATKNTDDPSLPNQIRAMSDDDLKEFITISDLKAMTDFLKGDLFKLDIIDNHHNTSEPQS